MSREGLDEKPTVNLDKIRAGVARIRARRGDGLSPATLRVRDLEALLDAVDAAPRNLACERLPERVGLPPNVEVCGHCTNCRFNAALARLDGDDSGGAA